MEHDTVFNIEVPALAVEGQGTPCVPDESAACCANEQRQ